MIFCGRLGCIISVRLVLVCHVFTSHSKRVPLPSHPQTAESKRDEGLFFINLPPPCACLNPAHILLQRGVCAGFLKMLFPILYWASGHYHRGLSGFGGIYRWRWYKNSPQGSSKRKVKGHFRNIDHFIKRTHAATVVGKNAATFPIIVTILTSSDWYKTTARPHKCTLRDWTIVSDSQCFCSF